MTIGKISLAILTIATLSPAVSNAAPERAIVKACARAFASSIAAPGATAPTYKLAYRGSEGITLSDFYPTEYTFTMEAHDKKSGEAFARASCSVDSNGVVTAIAPMPLHDKSSNLSAGL